MQAILEEKTSPTLITLPGDDVRQIMWRFADRYELQMLAQSARGVARGPVARLVAAGGRNSHEWTPEKAGLLPHFDESGITAAFLEPEEGGFIAGPKNLALALIAFELAWVDAGAATGSLASNLGFAPIHERGTPEQRAKYIAAAAPLKPGEKRKQLRAAFALTEPLPFVGVETCMLAGKVRVAEWKDGAEPLLQVEKRGRFITNMGIRQRRHGGGGFGRPENQGQLHGDFGGRRSRRLGPRHADEETRPPAFLDERPGVQSEGSRAAASSAATRSRTASSSRIISHGEIIEAVFRRTRVTVGTDDQRETAFRRRAGDSLSAPPVPRRRGRAGHAALRTGHPAKGRRAAPAGGHLGHRRGERVARFRCRAAV